MTSLNEGNYQLETWRGDFGNSYTDRNVADEQALRARTKVWAQMLRSIEGDTAFTSGVLIHVPPSDLLASCTEMHRVSRKSSSYMPSTSLSTPKNSNIAVMTDYFSSAISAIFG